MSETGIAWPGEAKKYTATPALNGGTVSDLVPPPNWMARYPNGYTEAQPPPNLSTDQHFQNWMRTAGLPTFTKLYSRNDADKLVAGRYSITVGMSAYFSFLLTICTDRIQTSPSSRTREPSRL